MYEDLDNLLLSQLRLAAMSYLMVVKEADFNTLKEQTGATSGNLSVQINKLQEAGYIQVEKPTATTIRSHSANYSGRYSGF
ncbi:MAG: transcriptional regulator [Lewinellaceae bacterium]|nr:transcriptional regulator [Lewinellaceae bacterium]